jgi:hypothetical protein
MHQASVTAAAASDMDMRVSTLVDAKRAANKLIKASRWASVGAMPSATGGAGGAGGDGGVVGGGKWRKQSKVFRRASLLTKTAANIAKMLATKPDDTADDDEAEHDVGDDGEESVEGGVKGPLRTRLRRVTDQSVLSNESESVEGGVMGPLRTRLRRVTDHSIVSNESEMSSDGGGNDELQALSLSALLALEEEREKQRLQTEVYNESRITQAHGPAVAVRRPPSERDHPVSFNRQRATNTWFPRAQAVTRLEPATCEWLKRGWRERRRFAPGRCSAL